MKRFLCVILTGVLLFGGFLPAETGLPAGAGMIVHAKETAPHLNYSKKTLQKGKSVTLKLVGGTAKSWRSSNTAVASVTQKGRVTAKRAGNATITCRGKNGKAYKCSITVKNPAVVPAPTPEEVYEKLIAMEEKYPEGTPWTNDNYYGWKGGIYSGGYGCAGFAFMLSDAAFGDLAARKHTQFSQIRVGDVVRVDYDMHSVIVLEVKDDSVVVAEGNYNGCVHWGREISFSVIEQTGVYVMTRYPKK